MAKVSLYDLDYVIFDFETTGLDPNKDDEIIEVGALKLKGGEATGEVFHSLIHIQKPIPKKASQIHGITDKDLQGQPTIEEIFPKFINFIGNRILIAHNASFDLEFVKKNLKRFPNIAFTNPCIDTLELSRQLFSYEKTHNLDAIANRFGIQIGTDRHRSLEDCQLTAQIFSEFLKTLRRQRNATLHHIRSCVLYPPKPKLSYAQESLRLL